MGGAEVSKRDSFEPNVGEEPMKVDILIDGLMARGYRED